ncbi:MAG TPA: hypothetical protein VKM54_12060, partial [Myxococcota bacterium]|nr:hypothetical protein [Myxococcota bacterium]
MKPGANRAKAGRSAGGPPDDPHVLPVRLRTRPGSASGFRWPMPEPLRSLRDEIAERAAELPTRLNEFGVDPFGYDPRYGRGLLLSLALIYR